MIFESNLQSNEVRGNRSAQRRSNVGSCEGDQVSIIILYLGNSIARHGNLYVSYENSMIFEFHSCVIQLNSCFRSHLSAQFSMKSRFMVVLALHVSILPVKIGFVLFVLALPDTWSNNRMFGMNFGVRFLTQKTIYSYSIFEFVECSDLFLYIQLEFFKIVQSSVVGDRSYRQIV